MIRFERIELSKLATTVARGACCAAALLYIFASAPAAHAYPNYDDGAGNGCVECHTAFQGGNPAKLHAQHITKFGITQCNLCHPSGGGSSPVKTYWSGPGGGLGCAGCHGNDYGETSSLSGLPKATGYGLRQAHFNAGVTVCSSCHIPGELGSPSPFPAILPENVAPPYFGQATNGLRNPCDRAEEESTMDADTTGLDNDGNGFADWPDDVNCAEPTTTTTTTTLPVQCEAAPTAGCVVADGGALLVNEKAAGKEKLKVTMKKLHTAVTQGQFGDPLAAGGTSYAICIYDQADQLRDSISVARQGDSCGSPPKDCWAVVSTKGYKYGDKDLTADGIQKMLLSGGDAGKGKIVVSGKNNAPAGQTALPTGVAALLQTSTQATVQLLTSDASCFGLTVTQVKKADGSTFSATGP